MRLIRKVLKLLIFRFHTSEIIAKFTEAGLIQAKV